jgi:biotin-(acetyl-CoA carboxylase) ligase
MRKIDLHHLSFAENTQDFIFEKLTPMSSAASPESWVGVVADTQGAGRGTHGRNWQATNAASQLLFSLGCCLSKPTRELPLPFLSLIAADALWSSLLEMGCPTSKLFIKWPNDLYLLSGENQKWKKLAGLLLEMRGPRFVVGLGLNISEAPKIEEAARLVDCWPRAPDFTASEARLRWGGLIAQNFVNSFELWSQNPGIFSQTLVRNLSATAMRPLIGEALTRKTRPQEAFKVAGLDPSGALRIVDSRGVEELVRSSEEIQFTKIGDRVPKF